MNALLHTTLEAELRALAGRVQAAGPSTLVLDRSAPQAADAVTALLAEELYVRVFTGWQAPDHARHSRSDGSVSGDSAYVARLREAVRGATTWEPGWTVRARGVDWVSVATTRIGLHVSDPTALRPPDAAPGSSVELRLPCARPGLSPGFFCLTARAGASPAESAHVRIYVHVTSAAAPTLLRTLVTGPAAEALRFEAKVVNDPALFSRRDTCVLYAAPEDAGPLLELLAAFRGQHPDALRAPTPPFAEEVFPGVAAGEGELEVPGRPRESFGSRRCRLVAEAVTRSVLDGVPPEQWLAEVARRFEDDGLSWTEPAFTTLRLVRDGERLRFESRAARG